jgi:hypothetical protein
MRGNRSIAMSSSSKSNNPFRGTGLRLPDMESLAIRYPTRKEVADWHCGTARQTKKKAG